MQKKFEGKGIARKSIDHMRQFNEKTADARKGGTDFESLYGRGW